MKDPFIKELVEELEAVIDESYPTLTHFHANSDLRAALATLALRAQPLSQGSLDLIGEMLEREESYANDYHQDEKDWIHWAWQIDVCRSEVGLPLLERMITLNPYTTKPQTMEESVRRRVESVED